MKLNPSDQPGFALPLFIAVFLASGLAGLIYQSIWSHYLGAFLGHAAYAQALVLALFMGGMAIGAWLVARFGENWRNLIRGYALLELIIGLAGLAFHWLYLTVTGLGYDILLPAVGSPGLAATMKWSLAAALILPQTILLGATFPLMAGGVLRRLGTGRDGRVLGGLYFANSLGAAAGALIAAFILLPRGGLPGAMVAAAIINFLVAGAAWLLGSGPEPRPRPVTTSAAAGGGRRRLLLVVLLATFASSAASFVYEVVFVRMLGLAVGNTLHAFELMLASFIAGIALGALWIRQRADSSSAPLALVGIMQLLMGLAALAAAAVYAGAFTWVGYLISALSPTDQGYVLFNAGTAAIAMLIMLPTAFFAGTTLPLFTVALLRSGQGEPAIGKVYAFNTLGAVVGVFAAVHLLIPLLGLKNALILAAAIDLGIGVILLWRYLPGLRQRNLTVTTASGAALAGVLATVLLVEFDPLRLASGVYRHGLAEVPEDSQVLFYRDGKTASVSVVRNPNGTVVIATNGKVDAAIQMDEGAPASGDEPTMVMLGSLPLAYHPAPRKAAVIGFGSGLTTHVVLGDPAIERVDSIEIESQMVAGARHFHRRVPRAFEDPRSVIHIDDAKSFLANRQTRYDVIISEPSNPWISGIGALFSREFYEFLPRHLAPDGVFVQWIQLYEIDDFLVGSILSAMAPAFADFRIYLANDSDMLIVASSGRMGAADHERLFELDLAADFALAGIERPEQLEFRRVGDARVFHALTRMLRQPAHSDFHPILSLEAPRTRFRGLRADHLAGMPDLGVPLLEWLGHRQPLAGETTTAGREHFAPEFNTRVARHLAELLAGGAITEDGRASATALAAWRRLAAFRQWCDADWTPDRQQWLLSELATLATRTIPYADPERLQSVFVDPAWLDCDPLPDVLELAMTLFGALSARDWQAMDLAGENWLSMERSIEMSMEVSAWAILARQAAAIQANQPEQAAALDALWNELVGIGDPYHFSRHLLLNWLAFR